MSSSAPKKTAPEIEAATAAEQVAEQLDEKARTTTDLQELFGKGARMGHGFRLHGHGLYPEPRRTKPRRQFDDE